MPPCLTWRCAARASRFDGGADVCGCHLRPRLKCTVGPRTRSLNAAAAPAAGCGWRWALAETPPCRHDRGACAGQRGVGTARVPSGLLSLRIFSRVLRKQGAQSLNSQLPKALEPVKRVRSRCAGRAPKQGRRSERLPEAGALWAACPSCLRAVCPAGGIRPRQSGSTCSSVRTPPRGCLSRRTG